MIGKKLIFPSHSVLSGFSKPSALPESEMSNFLKYPFIMRVEGVLGGKFC